MSSIVAIPARLNSSRFPRKVLVDIHGRSMLWHVYQGVSKAKLVSDTWVLTDSEEVFDEATSWGAKTLMTSPDCPSGTARIASVMDQLIGDIIVNVQGDEPMITGEIVDSVVTALEETDADTATPIFRIYKREEIADPNLVKVVRDAEGRALYFSRSPIPHVRGMDMDEWSSAATFWGHVGLYGYRRKTLLEYLELPEAGLEAAEKLEQLRLLESGKKIMTVEIDQRLYGVDTPEDLDRVKALLGPNVGSS